MDFGLLTVEGEQVVAKRNEEGVDSWHEPEWDRALPFARRRGPVGGVCAPVVHLHLLSK